MIRIMCMHQWPSHQGLHPFSEEEEEDNDGEEDPFADVDELESFRNQRRTNNNETQVMMLERFLYVFVERVR